LEPYAASLQEIVDAIKPVPESAMIDPPAGQVNHPAWTLSHLANSAAFIAFLLDEPCDDVGSKTCNTTAPVSDPSQYAS
jgi:hypothetical protein